jgi:hypothetical protein
MKKILLTMIATAILLTNVAFSSEKAGVNSTKSGIIPANTSYHLDSTDPRP